MSSTARTLTHDNAQELAAWCGGRAVTEHDALDHSVTSPGVNVPTKNGVERASLNDMIIRNHDGSFSVFK